MINSSSHFSYRDSCIESESYADRGPAPSKKIDPHSEKKIAGNSQNDVKKIKRACQVENKVDILTCHTYGVSVFYVILRILRGGKNIDFGSNKVSGTWNQVIF